MDFMEQLESQRHIAKYSIVDKKIMIGGRPGAGKTKLMIELMNILSEETNNKNIAYMLPFEYGYANYNLNKYVSPEYDFYNKDEKLKKNIICEKPTHYKNFLHICDGITNLVTEKLKNPNLPIQILAFDTIGSLIDLAKSHLKWEVFQRTKKIVTDNSYGTYGLIYKDAWELIDRFIMSKLTMVNYIPMMSFHIKEKKFPDKITGEDYTVYAPEIPASVYDKIFKDMNYVMMFEDNSFIKNGRLEQGDERILRWRDGGDYTGCKAHAPLELIPEKMNIKGLTDRQIAELVVSTIIGSIAEDGYTADKIKEELKKSYIELESSNKELIENRQQIIQEEETSMVEVKTRGDFISNLEALLKTVNDSSRVQLENYLKTATGDKSISDWASEVSKDIFNKVADTINGAISGIEGIEKLPRLE